jgi:hypothetical protein
MISHLIFEHYYCGLYGCHIKLDIDCARFVCLCPASKRGSRVRLLVDVRKKHRNATRASQLKSLCGGTKTRSDWDRQAQVRARQCSLCRARQHGIHFARKSNEHCPARQPRIIDTPPNMIGTAECFTAITRQCREPEDIQ